MRARNGRPKPYRIIGAYDSETTNDTAKGHIKTAFPILHQLGLIYKPIEAITPGNVEQETHIHLYRHNLELYEDLDNIAGACMPYVPVICCHNLSFDMYGLAPWLAQHDVKVLAKSQRKPISFAILDEAGAACLVIWDTLVFSQKSLGYMGAECGYSKLTGDWDYDKIRTPETPLTAQELDYARHDVYALLAWLGYWCRLNPDIDTADLGLRVVSKTGVVRRRRVNRFGSVKPAHGRKTIGQWWHFMNCQNRFGDDDELYTCIAATRGGFTFCARNNASRVFDFTRDDARSVHGFDATSQHPSQMVCHKYPVRFQKARPEDLTSAFEVIVMHTIEDVLENYERPFGVAFYGAFKFKNLRMKKDSLFERYGIAPLASARCANAYKGDDFLREENQQGEEFKAYIRLEGYKDTAKNPIYAFGKLEAASEATLYLTELTAWEISQAYDYDSVEAVSGYMTMSFDRPTDMCVVSVMQFYAAKNAFKHAQERYYNGQRLTNKNELIAFGIPSFVVEGMDDGSIDEGTVKSTYLGLKADLNALFGIEASNEYRRDTVLTSNGIEYEGAFGIENAPEHPKAWYQCGQRIVGWSRIAQIIVMELCEPHVDTIINGDTDSVKFVVENEELPKLFKALEVMNRAIDKAKHSVCARVKREYPQLFDSLDGIGYYVHEIEAKQFCAAWNKAYCIREFDMRDNRQHVRFTLAGVPCSRKLQNGLNVNQLADSLIENERWSFADVCNRFLGYNTTYSHDITGLNARTFPEWASLYIGKVTDYLGSENRVAEPQALCLYPMAKTVNDTDAVENVRNMRHSLRNNPSVCTQPCIVTSSGIVELKELIECE